MHSKEELLDLKGFIVSTITRISHKWKMGLSKIIIIHWIQSPWTDLRFLFKVYISLPCPFFLHLMCSRRLTTEEHLWKTCCSVCDLLAYEELCAMSPTIRRAFKKSVYSLLILKNTTVSHLRKSKWPKNLF